MLIESRASSDAELAALLAEVLDIGEDLGPSFFEVTTAATFLAFARHPADVCVIEVGLGGRFDATNVLDQPAACGIATLGIDHEAFLLVPEEGTPTEPLGRIAFEKAGIARPASPMVTQAYAQGVELEIERRAALAGAPLHMRGRDWWAEASEDAIAYRDRHGELTLPLPQMPGRHQGDNAALADRIVLTKTDLADPAAEIFEESIFARSESNRFLAPPNETRGGVEFQIADLNIGILWILAMTSLGVYAIVLAGWASGSNYPLLGGVRQLVLLAIAMAEVATRERQPGSCRWGRSRTR